MNKDYKEKLIELKNYLILASMIGGISLLPGCAGQKLEQSSNEQAAFVANIANVEIDSTLNDDDDVAIVVFENGKYIIHDLKYNEYSPRLDVVITNRNKDKKEIPYSKISMIFYTDEDATAHEKAVVFIDSLESETGIYIDYDDIQKKYKKNFLIEVKTIKKLNIVNNKKCN